MRKGALCLALLLGLSVATARAQEAGELELGAFGRYGWLDDNYRVKEGFGGGARLGWFFVRHWAISADASWMSFDPKDEYELPGLVAGEISDETDRSLDVVPVHLRLEYNCPLGDSFYGIVGLGVTHYKFTTEHVQDGDGAGANLGLRWRKCGSKLSIRADGTFDHLFNNFRYAGVEEIDTDHWGVELGLNLLLFGTGGDCDHDGVYGKVDKCPDTPMGERVDAMGCPLPKDADGDGVLDPNDRCPGTPAGEKVDTNGCTLPKDSDGDGVMDPDDGCPDTPRGQAVDSRGCPLPKDSDGDGVADPEDRCPGTPAGTEVDRTGCPKLFEEGETTINLKGVQFDTGKATLKPESEEVLEHMAELLEEHPDVTVEVEGHTDNTGSRTTNVRLSQARANTVRNFLIAHGVDAKRLTAKGYGPDVPIAPNDTPEGRAENRRVELRKTS